MKIVFDLNSIGDISRTTGVGNYAFNLIKNEVKLDQSNKYTVFWNSFNQDELSSVQNFLSEKVKVENVFSRLPNKLFYPKSEESFIPLNFLVPDIEILHLLAPTYQWPRLKNGKTVLTVHDLAFLVEEEYREAPVEKLRRSVGKLLTSVDSIIADSESTKKIICANFRISESKVNVIYLGVDSSFRRAPLKDILTVRKEKGLSKSYLIFVGTIDPRKNVSRIVKAYEAARNAKSYKGQLVLVGKRGWRAEITLNEVKKSKFKNDIKYLGYVGDKDLRALISGAEALLYPSLHEGFGLPILEGMACGVPVISSNVSSLPEVGGEAVMYVDPYSEGEIEEAIGKVTGDKELKNLMIRKGFDQVKKFTWEKTATQTLEVYRKILNS